MIHNLLMFDSPVQIVVVMVIALVVFGPKRLPEIGKQLGSALRELKKATGDVMHSFNTDYEPEPEPYPYNSTTEYESTSYSRAAMLEKPLDLTDYTIVGTMPVQHADGNGTGVDLDAYTIAAPAADTSPGPIPNPVQAEAGPIPNPVQSSEPEQSGTAAAAKSAQTGAEGESDA